MGGAGVNGFTLRNPALIFSAASRNIIALDYITSDSIDRAESTAAFTFSSQSIGAADERRVVIVCVGGFHGSTPLGTITGVTLGGVAMTQVVSRASATNALLSVTMWALLVPTGTTGTIVVSHGSATTCAISVYRMLSQTKQVTPTATDTAGGASTTSFTRSVTTTSKAGVVAATFGFNWANPTFSGITKDVGFDARSDEFFASGRSLAPGVDGALSITVTHGLTNVNIGWVAASWK